MRQRQALAILTVVVVAVLAACSKQDDTKSDDSAKSDKSQTPSASNPTGEGNVEETKLDPAMRDEVKSTVIAYFDALNKAFATGDTADAKALAHEKCNFCHQMTSYIEDVYGSGGRIEGAQLGKPQDITIGDLVTLTDYGIRQIHYAAKFPATASRTLDSSGTVVDSEEAELAPIELTIELDQSDKMTIRTWQVRDTG